jgi:hypothetical protein
MTWLKRKFTWVANVFRYRRASGAPRGVGNQTLRRKVRCRAHGCWCRLDRVVPLAPHGQRGYYICRRGGGHTFAIDRYAAGPVASVSRRKVSFRAA